MIMCATITDSSATSCPEGMYYNPAYKACKWCDVCKEGLGGEVTMETCQRQRNTVCLPCAEGHYPNNTLKRCLACPSKHFYDVARQWCTPCLQCVSTMVSCTKKHDAICWPITLPRTNITLSGKPQGRVQAS